VTELSESEPADEPGPFFEPESYDEVGFAADVAPKPSNGSEHRARRFESGWNQLLDPHRVKDQNFILPGHDGLPFRGNAIPFLKNDDPAYRQPQVAYEPHVWILDLSLKEDLDDYRAVYQLVTNGSAIISAEERQYDVAVKNWRVFLRWALVFAHMPKDFIPKA